MANTFSSLIPQILKSVGLPTLRENAIMTRLINTSVANVEGQVGQTVDVPIPTARTVRTVVPSASGPTNQDSTLSVVQVTLNNWRESTFYMTDKQMEETAAGAVPMQAQEALKALINDVEDKIFTDVKEVYKHSGSAGTTPFSTNLAAFKDARVRLNKGSLGGAGPASVQDRRVVLGPDAEGNALVLGQFLKADERGDQGGIITGNIGMKLGSQWFMDQNVKTFSNLVSLNKVTAVVSKVAYTALATTVTMDRATLTGKLKKGALFTITGLARQFVVTATVTAASNAIAVAISPALGAALASNITITFASPNKSSEVANLHFHRDAFALASRPLGRSRFTGEGGFQTIVDPVSGLVVRLEVRRQWRQVTWAWDILFGTKLTRPELCARVLG